MRDVEYINGPWWVWLSNLIQSMSGMNGPSVSVSGIRVKWYFMCFMCLKDRTQVTSDDEINLVVIGPRSYMVGWIIDNPLMK